MSVYVYREIAYELQFKNINQIWNTKLPRSWQYSLASMAYNLNLSFIGNGFDPGLKAGIAYLWFVTIHTLDSYNGRVAQAIQLLNALKVLLDVIVKR